MKVLVTGACGNVGALTVDLLLQRGHRVRGFDVDGKPNRAVADRWPDDRVEVLWSDIRDADAVRRAVAGVDHVLHLAAIIPPVTDLHEQLARDVNVGGTRNVIDACREVDPSPRLVFCSTAAVWGRNAETTGPRRSAEPLHPEDAYARQKVECEEMLAASDLEHTIFRLAVTPPISLAAISPFIFDFHPDTRVEFTHPRDVALALANTLGNDAVVGRTLGIGGGAANRMTYFEFMNQALANIGVPPLPRTAFGEHRFYTDWLDSEQSQPLLDYQRLGFATYLDEIRALVGPARYAIRPLGRLVRAYTLAHSRHHAAATGKGAWLLDLQAAIARLRGRERR